jgi:hypothetical protein
MPTAVFPIPPSYNLTHEIRFHNFIAEMGDGFEQRVNKNLSWGSRADGLGGYTSYKGLNYFTLQLTHLRHVNNSSTELANKLWSFYVARLGSYESFYFYNPVEAAIDPTGNSTTGRYLVRFADANLSRDNFVWHVYNVGLSLVEVRA